jgi:ATP-dependent protease Clp ATPase subunit
MVCTFCERPPSEVSKLLAGPNVYICDGCLKRVEGAAERVHASKERCSFCGKKGPERRVVAMAKASICTDCMTTARQILRDRAE